jgi:hypothetical protein
MGNYHNSSIIAFVMFYCIIFELTIILTYLRFKSNSVLPCILLHGSMNFIGGISTLFLPQTSFLTSFPNPLMVIALLPFALYYYIAGKQEHSKQLYNSTSPVLGSVPSK